MTKQNIFKSITNYFFPTKGLGNANNTQRTSNAKNPQNYLSKVQFQRVRVDIQAWRDAVSEAEQAFYPHRVKMQRIYQDTILNGQVTAAMQKRKNLVLLKNFCFYDSEGNENIEQSKILNTQWFKQIVDYCLDAKWFGYSLVSFGDVINNSLPHANIIKRWHISPDRKNIASYIYSLSGLNFEDENVKDDNGLSYADWLLYVDTPNETGASICGYGLLYKISLYEIYIRNNIGYNATALELFGQPIRVGTTSKTDEYDREEYANALQNMGSNNWILKDPTDELEIISGTTGAGKNQGFDNFEERCLKMINKIVFGHSDAMEQVAGKLGAEDASKESIEQVEKTDISWVENLVNDVLIPKLLKIGVNIPVGLRFGIANNKEKFESEERAIKLNKDYSEIASTMANAGLQMSAEYFTEKTGIPTEKIEQPIKAVESTKKKLENLYK
jgi:hypothetical protein